MKKLLFLFLTLSLAFTTSIAQCKYKENKTDEFTGKTIKRLKYQFFYSNILQEYLRLQLTKINDIRYIRIEWSTFSIRSIDKGHKFMFLLENGEKVEAEATDYEVASISGKVWISSLFYYISPENFEKLKESNVKKYRIYANQGYTEKELAEKKAEKFRKSLQCIN